MNRLSFNFGHVRYPYFIGENILEAALAEVCPDKAGMAVVISDDNVFPLHGVKVQKTLERHFQEVISVTVPAGEESKSLDQANSLYQTLILAGVNRHSWIFTLGGGMVGDLGGFVASTFMRGLPLVNLPTTLLAFADSSIGAKLAVNLPSGKNLVGSFYPPKAVIADQTFLKTLPELEFKQGWAEIIKIAVIKDAELFNKLGRTSRHNLSVITRAARVKNLIIKQDPYDNGIRNTLNLGHTFGHALEVTGGYRSYSHGESIALGMLMAAKIAARLWILQQNDLLGRLVKLYKLYNLPLEFPACDWEELKSYLIYDKKRAQKLVWVLPVRTGEVVLSDKVSLEMVEEIYYELLNHGVEYAEEDDSDKWS